MPFRVESIDNVVHIDANDGVQENGINSVDNPVKSSRFREPPKSPATRGIFKSLKLLKL
ncbi:MAG: hypothetical protein MJZ78_05595 [Bacteroidales bacterium]|nr:hypothetical protein [Bacteroidales bacterium]